MIWVQFWFGVLFLVICSVSSYAYVTKNEKLFWKKHRYISFWGEKWGLRLHFFSYVIIPLLAGILFIASSIMNVSL